MRFRTLALTLVATTSLSAPARALQFYVNPATGKKQPVPRHTEVDEHLARHIRRVLGVPE